MAVRKKKITTFSLDEDVIDPFDKICKMEQRSRSNMANILFKDFLSNKKRKK